MRTKLLSAAFLALLAFDCDNEHGFEPARHIEFGAGPDDGERRENQVGTEPLAPGPATPEPTGFVLFGAGLAAVWWVGRRRG